MPHPGSARAPACGLWRLAKGIFASLKKLAFNRSTTDYTYLFSASVL